MYSEPTSRKHGLKKFFRNADAAAGACVVALIGGLLAANIGYALCVSLGLDEIYKNGDFVLNKPMFWIGGIINVFFNLVAFAGLSCLISKINPKQRHGGVGLKFLAVLCCAILWIIYILVKTILAGHGWRSIWDLVFFYEFCRGLWRWVVGAKHNVGDRSRTLVSVNKANTNNELVVKEVNNELVNEHVSGNVNQRKLIGGICSVLVLLVIGCLLNVEVQNLNQKKELQSLVVRGQNYEYGRGVEQNMVEAVRCYREAAERGSSWAQYELGCCYEGGAGVVRDYSEAVKWYREAAEQGNRLAMRALGLCYGHGRGVDEDESLATEWYRKAADKGDSLAMVLIATRYVEGRGVEKDDCEAVKWYRKAAEKGRDIARYRLGECYEKGIGVAKNEREAIRWYRTAADSANKDVEKIAKEALMRLGVED